MHTNRKQTRSLLLALALVLVAPGRTLAAAVADSQPSASAPAGDVPDTALGVIAAVGCGFFGRALLAGVVAPGVIAGAIATCGYMIVDGLTHER